MRHRLPRQQQRRRARAQQLSNSKSVLLLGREWRGECTPQYHLSAPLIIFANPLRPVCRLVLSVELEGRGGIAAMSTAILAAIAVILCILFRILNVNSQPQIPNIWCRDASFLEMVLKISPMVREP